VTVKIEALEGEEAATEFVLFHDRVYADRSARWPASPEMQVPLLTGQSPYSKDRETCAFIARQGGEIAARVLAVVDGRYNRHWNERLGHVALFEALPGADDAVRSLMDEACGWLAERGTEAARAGFCMAALETPFAMDAYDVLPPSLLRQNPPYYHRMLKRAGFVVEKGMVDYKLRVTPELEKRWEGSLESVRASEIEIVPFGELDPSQRVRDLTDTWADTFKHHWGFVAFDESEMAGLLDGFADTTLLETSCLAYLEGEPVGFLFNPSDPTDHAILGPGRTLDDSEKLNVLGIGVREQARGRGINYAMAGYSYLELARRGRTHLSYTFVLDDNWPSRRTGEGLGAEVCANYLAYRRDFRR
jgi:hypothetical protein